MKSVPRHGLHIGLLILAALSLTGLAAAQANIQGQWSTLGYTMPINPVHVALMRNGKVLVVSGSGNDVQNLTSNNLNAAVWDPASGSIATQSLAWDMFCDGMIVLPDGRPFIIGGTIQYDPFYGQRKTALFDPDTNAFTNAQNMAHGRWYPTPTVLSDGRVMIFSGLDDVSGSTNTTVEIYTPGTGWGSEIAAGWTPPLYPRMHLLPSGKVFYSGSTTTSRLFNPATGTWSTVANTKYGSDRNYGSSVLLPLRPANGYVPKVMIFGGGSPATATTEIIDLSANNPAWSYGPPMSQGRIEMSSVILPTGKILAIGGSVNDEDSSTASFNADLYDPATNAMSSAGANGYARLYHSVALLLPDATVWFAGGNPSRGSYETHMEIYTPAYLFTTDLSGNPIPATRPTISAASGEISYGNTFNVQTPDAAGIAQAVLVRAGSATHAFDFEQRLVGMTFTTGAGSLTVTAPPNGSVAPPGYYMLFLLDSNGVPSIAKFVHLSQAVTPDFTVGVSPISQSVLQGSAIPYTVSSAAIGGFSGTVSFSVTGLPTGASATFNPTSVVGSGSSVLNISTSTTTPPGTYTLSITGTSGALVHSTPATLVVTLPTAATPTFNPAPGTYTTSQNVTLADTTAGATIYYTTNNSTPTTSSPVYTNPIPVIATTTIKAIAGAPGFSTSAVATGTYTISGAPPPPGITFVQSNTGPTSIQSSNSTIAVPFSVAEGSGHLNVVAIGWGDTTASVSSVTDTLGNTYNLAVGPTTNTGMQQVIYYAKNIIGGSNTVTVRFNVPAAYPDVRILEYAGADATNPLDAKSGAAGSGTAANSGSAATTAANELIFGSGTTGNTFTAAGSGFTSRLINIYGSIAEDKIATTTGSYNATGTVTSSVWIMQMATFRPSGPTSPAPTVTGISPASGTTAGGTTVTITGTGFQSGATVKFGSASATNVVVGGSTSLTATTPANAASTVNVVVTNTDTQSGTLAAAYTYTNSAPTVTGISPNSGTTAGGTSVTITGTGFLSGASVTIGGAAATNIVVVGPTSITAKTPAHAAGATDVVVTNTDTQSGTLSNSFTFNVPNPAPTVTGISPTSGTTAGGTAVSITGTGFLSGATVSVGGTAATNVVVVGSTSITATTPAHAAGAVNVVVTNTDAQAGTLTNGYTYTNPAPTVTGISPNSGTTAGGTSVTITGTGFLSGASVTIGGAAATNIVVASSTSISARTPAHAAGVVDVVVTNTDTKSGTGTGIFTYQTATSGITFVQANSAPTSTKSSLATLSAQYPTAQRAGDLNVVVIGWGDAASAVASVTDTAGNTYTRAIGPTATATIQQSIFYAKNIVGGANTVTVQFNTSAAYPDIRVLEYSGADPVNPVDVTGAAVGTGTTATSSSATTTVANELIFGAGTTENRFTGAGTNFVSRIIDFNGNIAEDRTVTATGSYNTSAKGKSAAWIMQMVTFK